MIPLKLLWTQKANSRSNIIINLAYFTYEFISARFSIFAFLALFNVLTKDLEIYGDLFIIGLSITLYYLVHDLFNVFWTGINLKYSIYANGIGYNWGVLRNHELFVPFNKINIIKSITGDIHNRNSLVFDNVDKIKNGDFGFSKEIYFKELSFENITAIDKVIKILNIECKVSVSKYSKRSSIPWSEKSPNSYLYTKVLQLFAFIFLYLSTSISMKIIDNNYLLSQQTVDKVIQQKIVYQYENDKIFNLITESGHHIYIEGAHNYVGENVRFNVSPTFNDITEFHSFKSLRYESLENGYIGLELIFKYAAFFILTLSASYIFYKRGIIPVVELSLLLLGPIFILFIAFYLFR